jgi:hypothetical protein
MISFLAICLASGTAISSPEPAPADDDRVFTVVKDTVVEVEGTPQRSRKVEEYRRSIFSE